MEDSRTTVDKTCHGKKQYLGLYFDAGTKPPKSSVVLVKREAWDARNLGAQDYEKKVGKKKNSV